MKKKSFEALPPCPSKVAYNEALLVIALTFLYDELALMDEDPTEGGALFGGEEPLGHLLEWEILDEAVAGTVDTIGEDLMGLIPKLIRKHGTDPLNPNINRDVIHKRKRHKPSVNDELNLQARLQVQGRDMARKPPIQETKPRKKPRQH